MDEGAAERREQVYEHSAASHLCLHDCLNLSDEDLGAGRLLVRHLECNALMVQRVHVVRHVYCMPDLVPLMLWALRWE